MFTGIVEELGKLKKINRGSDSARLVIAAEKVLEDVKIGDSIAINGICLTVVSFNGRFFEADVMAETLRRTNLGQLKPGEGLNLERALRVGDRLGGHIVSGHIDGVGTITNQKREDIALLTEITASPEVMKYILVKGSVAVDGVSLTVVKHTENTFIISLIPHSAKMTTLGYKKVGDKVNLEIDILGRYVERLLSYGHKRADFMRPGNPSDRGTGGGLTMEYLAEKGFL